eukprot:scaffold826_cov186-Chaetoceros_neogracile.AAC.1
MGDIFLLIGDCGSGSYARLGGLFLKTPRAVNPGQSGNIRIETGMTENGNSGSIQLFTGDVIGHRHTRAG